MAARPNARSSQRPELRRNPLRDSSNRSQPPSTGKSQLPPRQKSKMIIFGCFTAATNIGILFIDQDNFLTYADDRRSLFEILSNTKAAERVHYVYLDKPVPFMQLDDECVRKWIQFNYYCKTVTFDGNWDEQELSKFLQSFYNTEKLTLHVTGSISDRVLTPLCEVPNKCPLKVVFMDTTQTSMWPFHWSVMGLLPAAETLDEAWITVVHIPRDDPMRQIEPILHKFKKGCQIHVFAEMFVEDNIQQLKNAGFDYKPVLAPREHKFVKKFENVTINIRINGNL